MCVWAMTSASRWAVPLPPLWVDEDDVVDVVEPWMAWLIQCSMLMLPWLEVGVPCESPCTEPSLSEPEEVSMGQSRAAVWPSQEAHADPATQTQACCTLDGHHISRSSPRPRHGSHELWFGLRNVSSKTPPTAIKRVPDITISDRDFPILSTQQSGKKSKVFFAQTHKAGSDGQHFLRHAGLARATE